jgi:hypothetical protein
VTPLGGPCPFSHAQGRRRADRHTVEAFAEANKFRRLPDDNVATNPAVRFRVETFEPSEGFQPRKPYQSRLKWRDQDGNEQSKLLLTKPRR